MRSVENLFTAFSLSHFQITSSPEYFTSFAQWDRRTFDVFGRRLIGHKIVSKEKRLADKTSALLNNGEKAPHYLTSRMAGKEVDMRNVLQSCVSAYLPTVAQAASEDAAYSVLHSAWYDD